MCTQNKNQTENWRECITMNIRTGSPTKTVYLTQWIKVGLEPQLVMYDRGSNTNLIVGKLAEMENMKIVSNNESGWWTKYKCGVYKAVLGPSITGENRYLDCQGVNTIAGSLRKQSLKEVNKELRSFGLVDQHTPLPRYAAGGSVGVLMGKQDIQLDPVLIAVLPSGIGVYRCPFVDMWGSQIANAGPHPSFSTPTAKVFSSSLFSR